MNNDCFCYYLPTSSSCLAFVSCVVMMWQLTLESRLMLDLLGLRNDGTIAQSPSKELVIEGGLEQLKED